MQTFVPAETFLECAQILDYRRLGKQRVECLQILNALEGQDSAWRHHPATLMWQGFEAALRRYQAAMIQEWVRRGYQNTMVIPNTGGRAKMPPWWGGPIHSSHRSALLYKDYNYYKQFRWRERPKLAYIWPISKSGVPE